LEFVGLLGNVHE